MPKEALGLVAASDRADGGARAATAGAATADDAFHAQQMAGLAALIRISAQVSSAMAPATRLTATDELFLPRDLIDQEQSDPGVDLTAQGSKWFARVPRLRLLVVSLRTDHLVRNSLYLMLSAAIQGGLGFIFWTIMARLYSTDDVGRASSLISATALITYFSLFGLNTTLMRFLPTSRRKHSLLTAAFVLVACSGAVIGLGYILLIPVIAPRLAFVTHQPALALGFVLLTSAAALNLLTDSVFISTRKAGFCALTDGVVGGFGKIIFGVLLAGTGAYGLYGASVGASATAALVSVVLIVMTFRWRPSLTGSFRTIRPLLGFSGANYAANAIQLLPTLVVPLFVLDRIGAQAAAYYFVAFQMAGLLYAAVYAVESAFMAEGSQAKADWRAVRRRSRRLAVRIFVPAGAFLALTAHWILLAFGVKYSQHATTSLELLAASVIPLAACNWSWTVLRLRGKLSALVASTAVYSTAVCGFAWMLSSHGLTWVAAAWPIGTSIAAVFATVAAAMVPAEGGVRNPAMAAEDRARDAAT